MNNEHPKYLSAVIPVFNDEEVLDELISRLKPALQKLSKRFEIVLIDDGSADQSWGKIESLSNLHPEITGIKLARNFGQQGAIKAGLDHSKGDYMVIMDSDLRIAPRISTN